MKKILLVSLCLVLVASVAMAKNSTIGKSLDIKIEVNGNVSDHEMYPVQAAATQGTAFLGYYTFDQTPLCVAQGWTTADVTSQFTTWFHVSDFTTAPDNCGPGSYGGLYAPEGTQALWCGVCPSAANPYCGYAQLPGYGNGWNQAWCSDCVVSTDTLLNVDYMVVWDSEPGYDATVLEYDICDGTYVAEGSINGGAGVYDGFGALTENITIATGAAGSYSLRFHFTADGAWSDEDGLWDTDGAIIIDSLTVSDGNGNLIPTELFEDEALQATVANNWAACTPPGYGDLAQLIQAVPTTYQNNPVEEDPCRANFSCLWNFVAGSTANYACNTPNPSPQQAAIPYVNARNQYISNEIWSPLIPFLGSGAITNVSFDVYRDLALNALIFYVWHVRSNVAGCLTGWADRNFVYYGGGKDWLRAAPAVGDVIRAGATDIQVALGVVDMCLYWCGVVGTGACHAHAPLIDNVRVYRVAVSGPQFSGRDIDMLHDNFSTDGTITGTARVDMAQDILPSSSPNITHGDSAKVTVNDPEVGLAGDSYTGCGPAVYCFISVDPANYAPLAMQAPETRGVCGLRYPHATTVASAGRTWEVYRMDSSFTRNGGLVADQYCIDFNDNLFVPGDTCWFFFGAQNTGGVWNYWNAASGSDASMAQTAAFPDEFTILPAVGDEPGNDILYVDGMNFRGAQPYFDTAFQNLNIFDGIDRYDIRGPSSGVGNRPGSRVVNVVNQMIPIYRKIIWNTGDLTLGCIGDGVGYEKSDDASMLFNWINNLAATGGIYFNGDDLADEWSTLTGPGAIQLSAYCAYTVVSPNHVAHGVGVAPKVRGVAGPAAMFVHGGVPDSMVAFGGCPLINDFDVLNNSAGVSDLQMEYIEEPDLSPVGPTTGGAIVSQTTLNAAGFNVKVILSGFSYHYIRDIDYDGITDRYTHMYWIITHLDNLIDDATPVVTNTRTNSLAQNYPNPFNPRTTIKYTIKEQAHVSLRIYNVAGQLVRTLVDEVQRPDEVVPQLWDGMNNTGQTVSSGVYFYKLVTKNFTQTKKMVLLK